MIVEVEEKFTSYVLQKTVDRLRLANAQSLQTPLVQLMFFPLRTTAIPGRSGQRPRTTARRQGVLNFGCGLNGAALWLLASGVEE